MESLKLQGDSQCYIQAILLPCGIKPQSLISFGLNHPYPVDLLHIIKSQTMVTVQHTQVCMYCSALYVLIKILKIMIPSLKWPIRTPLQKYTLNIVSPYIRKWTMSSLNSFTADINRQSIKAQTRRALTRREEGSCLLSQIRIMSMERQGDVTVHTCQKRG